MNVYDSFNALTDINFDIPVKYDSGFNSTNNPQSPEGFSSPDGSSETYSSPYSEGSKFPNSNGGSTSFTVENLPSNSSFESMEEGFLYISRFASRNGFLVVKRRTRKDRNKNLVSCDIICDRGREHNYKPKEGAKQRNCTSKRTGCEFKWRLSRGKAGWVITPVNNTHNHGRKHQLSEEQSTLINLFYTNLKNPAEIMESFNILYPDQGISVDLIKRSIQKYKTQLCDKLFQYTSSRQDFICKRRGGSGSSFILASKQSIDLFGRVPTVLKIMPVTNSETFGMSVMEIFQMIHKGDEAHGLPVCLIFMKSRKQDEYDWSVEQIMQLCCKAYIPKIIISDCDANLMDSIKNIIPNTTNLLCSWMIRKRILDQLEKIAPNLLRQSRLMDMVLDTDKWNGLVHQTRTPEEFDAAFQRVSQDLANDFRPFMTYVQETWIDQHKTRFISAWTNSHTHFGFTVDECSWFDFQTPRTDQYPLGNNEELYMESLLKKISVRVEFAIKQMSAEEYRYDLDTTLFGNDVKSSLDPIALNKAVDEHTKARILDRLLEEDGIGIPDCDGIFTITMGIPCSHTIRELYTTGQQIRLFHFHKHWHRVDESLVTPGIMLRSQKSRLLPLVGNIEGISMRMRSALNRGQSDTVTRCVPQSRSIRPSSAKRESSTSVDIDTKDSETVTVGIVAENMDTSVEVITMDSEHVTADLIVSEKETISKLDTNEEHTSFDHDEFTLHYSMIPKVIAGTLASASPVVIVKKKLETESVSVIAANDSSVSEVEIINKDSEVTTVDIVADNMDTLVGIITRDSEDSSSDVIVAQAFEADTCEERASSDYDEVASSIAIPLASYSSVVLQSSPAPMVEIVEIKHAADSVCVMGDRDSSTSEVIVVSKNIETASVMTHINEYAASEIDVIIKDSETIAAGIVADVTSDDKKISLKVHKKKRLISLGRSEEFTGSVVSCVTASAVVVMKSSSSNVVNATEGSDSVAVDTFDSPVPYFPSSSNTPILKQTSSTTAGSSLLNIYSSAITTIKNTVGNFKKLFTR